MKKIIAEFREFAMKGNVLDMAVGVVLGGAFSAIITSLVKDILMPLLSIVIGRINISNLQFTIPGLFGSPDIVLTYGAFLQSVINFLSIALALFICLKFLNRAKDRLHKSEAVEKEKEPELSKSEELLAEIRDLLKSRDKET
jgi:large conductance mechanosensitive channel